jgi:hypothetical protein
MEMALDAVIQTGRLTGGGVVELRGNGQLIQRSMLEASGGFQRRHRHRRLGSQFSVVDPWRPRGDPLGPSGPGGSGSRVVGALEAASTLGGRWFAAIF